MTLVPAADQPSAAPRAEQQRQLITLQVGGQLVGIPVGCVQDVLGPQRITRAPLAPPEVAGSLNLRGRIVTAIDLRARLRMPPRPAGSPAVSVVVDRGGELYGLLIDQVGEVLSPPADRFEDNLIVLTPKWREVAVGIYRLDERLLIVLDVDRLLAFDAAAGA